MVSEVLPRNLSKSDELACQLRRAWIAFHIYNKPRNIAYVISHRRHSAHSMATHAPFIGGYASPEVRAGCRDNA